MDFEEWLNKIKNFKSLGECCEIFDFSIDAERIHLENSISTGYKHERLCDFSDEEILILEDELHKRIDYFLSL